jgi:hypothetical protein
VVGWQVTTALSLVEEHDQRAAVVAADLLAGGPPVRCGDVDHDHIGRWSVDQLDGRADHVDVAMLAVQGEQLGAKPHAPVQEGNPLRHVDSGHRWSLCWSACQNSSDTRGDDVGATGEGEWTGVVRWGVMRLALRARPEIPAL